MWSIPPGRPESIRAYGTTSATGSGSKSSSQGEASLKKAANAEAAPISSFAVPSGRLKPIVASLSIAW